MDPAGASVNIEKAIENGDRNSWLMLIDVDWCCFTNEKQWFSSFFDVNVYQRLLPQIQKSPWSSWRTRAILHWNTQGHWVLVKFTKFDHCCWWLLHLSCKFIRLLFDLSFLQSFTSAQQPRSAKGLVGIGLTSRGKTPLMSPKQVE
jgi:hypothetical protein